MSGQSVERGFEIGSVSKRRWSHAFLPISIPWDVERAQVATGEGFQRETAINRGNGKREST